MSPEFIAKYNCKISLRGYSVSIGKLQKINFSSWMKCDTLMYTAMVTNSRTL